MKQRLDYQTAQNCLLQVVSPVDCETLEIGKCSGRILAQKLTAVRNVPPFDRSPLDGYAFFAADTSSATPQHPVTLRVTGQLPAGSVPSGPLASGCAVRLMTGAPIPEGADAVVKYEDTEFTQETVTLFSPAKSGQNIVRAGEDVRAGTILALSGDIVGPGLAGTFAAQGLPSAAVYRIPTAGILSTGVELAASDGTLSQGKIYDSNRYMLQAALKRLGYSSVFLGMVRDSVNEISDAIVRGLCECDVLICTGGVSVGDYDLVPAALEKVGAKILFRHTDFKPGSACAYAVCRNKLICGLSGNPASALTNFHVVACPALKKLAGYGEPLPKLFPVALADDFPKKSRQTRFLRGILALEDGTARMHLKKSQGNAVLSSSIGCNVMARVPAGSGPLSAGTVLEAFLL